MKLPERSGMRILYCTDTFRPEVNGVTTVLATMRDGLRRRGHDVMVLCPRYDRPTDDETGLLRLAAVRCPGYGQVRLSWPWGRGLDRRLEAFNPDLVHLVTEGPLGLFGRGFARRRGRPVVTSFHTDFPRYAAQYLGRWAVAPTRAWMRRFHAGATFTQTPSAATRDDLLALGVPRPVVWGRGVDTALFHPSRRTRPRGAGPFEVLHVGRLAVEKDVATLVAALRLAHDRLGSRASFTVAGDGPEAARVRETLPFARHLGFLDRGTLAGIYADAELFVFPSPTETCGLVALEALASGVPVIGAAAGGIPESLREGITGHLAPAGDAVAFADRIVELAGDPERRAAMGEAARAFAVGRDWQRELDELEADYDRVRYASRAAPAPSAWPTSTSVA